MKKIAPNLSKLFPVFILCIFFMQNCQPPKEITEDEPDQCSNFNIFYTALVDQQYTGNCSAIDDIVEAYLARPTAPQGCAIGIVYNNGIYYLKGDGKAQLVPDRNFTYATPSVVGSISKTLTALGILKLVEGGYIRDIHDPAHLYLPPGTIIHGPTIHQLLGHGVGISRDPVWHDHIVEGLDDLSDAPHPGADYLVVMECINAWPTTTLGAGQGAYSNTGYTILGGLIDGITRNEIETIPAYTGVEGYEQYIYRVVGEDAGMYSMCINTYWRFNDILGMATGYRANSEVEFTAASDETPRGGPGGWRGPAGGWAMTIGDLCRLMIAMNTNDIVNELLMEEMTSANYELIYHDDLTPSGVIYGLGVMKSEDSRGPYIVHLGNIDGYSARYTYWPERNLGVAIMVNEQSTKEHPESLRGFAVDLADLFTGFTLPCPVIAHAEIEPENINYVNTIRAIASKNKKQYSKITNAWLDDLTKSEDGKKMMKALETGDVPAFTGFANSLLNQKRKKSKTIQDDQDDSSLHEIQNATINKAGKDLNGI